MKGFRDAAGNALSLIVGSPVGVAAYYGCYRLEGMKAPCWAWRWYLRWSLSLPL